MISKEEREKDKAVLATATARPWIAVSPRSQDGGPQLASFGGLDAPGLPTSLRSAEDMGPVDAIAAQARMTWGQHAANCRAAVHAVNRLPAYIADAEEMDRRLDTLAEIARQHDAGERRLPGLEVLPPEVEAAVNKAVAETLRLAVRIVRGEP